MFDRFSPAFLRVGYAYATSTLARDLGAASTGCFYFTTLDADGYEIGVGWNEVGACGPYKTAAEAAEWAEISFPGLPFDSTRPGLPGLIAAEWYVTHGIA